MPKQYCPSCAQRIIPPYGSPKAEVLLIGPYPGEKEAKVGRPFAGNTGRVLRRELWREGYDLLDFRTINVWMHLPNKNENCFNAGRDHAIEEGQGRRAILLIGSETVQTFTDYKVSDVSGLIVDSVFFDAELIMASVNPATVFKEGAGVGEIRFALQQFIKELKARNIR